MKLFISYLVLGVAVSLSAFAENRVQELTAENPDATPFQVLEKLFNESNTPASMQDFDSIEGSSNMKCAGIAQDEKELVSFCARRIDVTVPGKASNGPLFPGTPDQTMSFIGTGACLPAYDVPRSKQLIKRLLPFVQLSTTETELIMHVNKNDESSVSPITISFRRNSALISIRSFFLDSTKWRTRYSYCWRE